MSNLYLASTIGLIVILLQQIADASTIPPQSLLQGASLSEESDSNIPNSLPLGNDDETRIGGVHPLRSNLHTRGGSTMTMKISPVDEGTVKTYSPNHFFTVNSRVPLRPPGKPNDNSISAKSTRQRTKGAMDYESIALALRLTCEVNRRLNCATAPANQSTPFGLVQSKSEIDQGQAGRSVLDRRYNDDRYQYQHQSEQYQHIPLHPINVISPQVWQRPTREGAEVMLHDTDGSQLQPDLHKSISRATPGTEMFDTPQSQRKSLTDHVRQIANILEYGPIVPALALKFLDRASSVETKRGDGQYHNHLLEKTCPYLTSQTVHKLYLAAVILANRTVRGEVPMQSQHFVAFHDEYTQFYAERLIKGGIEITPLELGNMMEWMYHSLGTEGVHTSRADVDQLLTSWKGLFKWEA